jgi:MinD-like ATPase involved in chromosome partitioning or flagellar assembly
LNQFLRSECEIEEVAFSIGDHTGDDPGRKKLAGQALWLVPSSINSAEISQVLRDGYDIGKLNEGIQTLIKRLDLDYLFIDTHPGLQEETLLSLAISDILMLVLRPDQQDFQGTAVTLDVARGLDVPTIYLVVNKLLSRYDPAITAKQISETYQASVAGVLPLTEDLADLGSVDIFSLTSPDHTWSRALRGIAQVVIDTEY